MKASDKKLFSASFEASDGSCLSQKTKPELAADVSSQLDQPTWRYHMRCNTWLSYSYYKMEHLSKIIPLS